MNKTEKSILEDDLENWKFVVLGNSGQKYCVDFGKADGKPSCACQHWINTNFPCKHFFLIFQYKEKWKWDSLPKCYLNSPYLSADISLSEVLLELPAEENIKDDVPGETKLKLSTPTVDDVQQDDTNLDSEVDRKASELSTMVSCL